MWETTHARVFANRKATYFTDRKVDEGGSRLPFQRLSERLGVHRQDLGSQWNYELGWIHEYLNSEGRYRFCFRYVRLTWMQKPAAFCFSLLSHVAQLLAWFRVFWIKNSTLARFSLIYSFILNFFLFLHYTYMFYIYQQTSLVGYY